jgi:hypothetical protein
MTERRFPRLGLSKNKWRGFVARDNNGQALAEEPGRKRKQALSFAATQRTGAPNIEPEFIFERRKFSQ